jgi:general secretion pathway protein A
MYLDSFGLKKKPFSLTSDPSMLYLTDFHREALAALCYGVLERKGLLLLLGHAGTGKTSLLTCAIQRLPPGRVQFAPIINPTNEIKGFLESVLLSFGIRDIPASRPRRLGLLERHLVQTQMEGKIAVLMVDEAHKLSPKALEEVRLLSNLEQSSEKLLQIVLAGQNEMRALLNRADCVQLKQRVALRVTLRTLTPSEVGPYIGHRWLRASGNQRTPFTVPAVEMIARLSHGVPRVVNVICDNALLAAFGERSETVETAHVIQSCIELDLTEAPAETAADTELPPRKLPSDARRVADSPPFSQRNKWAAGG